jgi:outer membrane protein assembly factor BamB
VIWKCDCIPDRKAAAEKRALTYFIGTPVIHDDKAYVTMGLYPDHPHGTPPSYVLCIDMTKSGDVSPKILDAKSPANKDSALVWAFGGSVIPRPAKGRREYMASTMSTCAIHDGLLYVSELRGYLHCLDAKTGQRYWEHDLKTGIWGSPYYVDGKVYVGTDDAEVIVLQHGKDKKVLAVNEMDDGIQSTPVVANGVLYVMTGSKLYAIAQKK